MNQTYREMKEQYAALKQTEAYFHQQADVIRAKVRAFNPAALVFIGCGSGFCLCQSAELSARLSLKIPAYAIPAGDLMLRAEYYAPMFANSLIVAPTRSGSTSELILAINAVRKISYVEVIAIACVEDSAIAKIADLTLCLPWAYDCSVCQTRCVTNLYAASLMLTRLLAGDDSLDTQINQVIKRGPAFLENIEPRLNEIAAMDWDNVRILADGEMSGIASEGVMAFCEIAQIAGSHYHLLDIRHGPMVLVNEKTLVIAALSDDHGEQQVKVIRELVERGAIVVTYRDQAGETIPGVAAEIESGLSLDNPVQGIPFINLSQILALAKARHLGINPDSPAGIVAWVNLG